MKIEKRSFFRKKTIFVCIMLLTMSVFLPISNGLSTNTKKDDFKPSLINVGSDFSVTIHKISQIDEIDPFPHTEDGEWVLRVYANNQKQSIQCTGKNVILDEIITWEDLITENMKYVEIKMELLEDDFPDADDIADISAYIDENYKDKDYDDTDDFNAHRPCVFNRYFNLITMEWMPVDDDNDFLEVDYQDALPWYVTSGNYDGSTTVDENDAAIWFNCYIKNNPPVPPEKPVGQEIGWVGNYYTYTTRTFDEDGDKVAYAWDWDGDGVVDEVTSFFESGQTIQIVHAWDAARIFYFRVKAIDEWGFASEWSEPFKVEINGPYGKTGFEIEKWSLGDIYSVYLDHFETQNLISTLRGGGNIVTAAAALISAVAMGMGIPLDISISITIVTSILRIGVEILNMLDKGMGIYIKAYLIVILDCPMNGIGYAWTQKYTGNDWEPGEENTAPYKPDKPSGEAKIRPNQEYVYSSKAVDPDDDLVAYVFEWGDGTFSCVHYNNSGDTVESNHLWAEEGQYAVRLKAIDIFGFESEWSDPLSIEISKSKSFNHFTFSNFCLEVLNRFFVILKENMNGE